MLPRPCQEAATITVGARSRVRTDDPHQVGRRCRQAGVGGDEWAVEPFGQRDVHAVLDRDPLPQLPRPLDQHCRQMANDDQSTHPRSCIGQAVMTHGTSEQEAVERGDHLDVEVHGDVQLLTEEATGQAGMTEGEIDCCRRVKDERHDERAPGHARHAPPGRHPPPRWRSVATARGRATERCWRHELPRARARAARSPTTTVPLLQRDASTLHARHPARCAPARPSTCPSRYTHIGCGRRVPGRLAQVDRRIPQCRPCCTAEPARVTTLQTVDRDDPGYDVGLDRGERTAGETYGHHRLTVCPTTQGAVDIRQPGWGSEHRDLQTPAPGDAGHGPHHLGEADGGRLVGDWGEVSRGHDVIQAPGSDSRRSDQLKQAARNASKTSVFGSTWRWPSSPREMVSPGQKKSASGVKKCGDPIT